MPLQVPLKRVNQAYVIATSTKVDTKALDISKFDDVFFKAAEEPKKKKGEEEFFKAETEEKKVCCLADWHSGTADRTCMCDISNFLHVLMFGQSVSVTWLNLCTPLGKERRNFQQWWGWCVVLLDCSLSSKARDMMCKHFVFW